MSYQHHHRTIQTKSAEMFRFLFNNFHEGDDMVGADLMAMDDSEIDKLIFWRSLDSMSTVLEGETVILDIESGVYSGLNEVGTSVWNLLENRVTFADMREAILAEFDVPAEECSNNLLSFLKKLAQNKLIEVMVDTNS
jgi:hypothetical protein